MLPYERIREKPHVFARLCYWAVLALVYAIAASQTVASFSYKWTTVADHPQYSLEKTLSFTAPRPYAYRLLMPFVVSSVTERLPATFAQPLYDRAYMALNNTLDEQLVRSMPDHAILGYGVVIMLNFILMMGGLWMLRSLAQQILGQQGVLRDVGPILFALMLTISYRTTNGFIYDYAELCLFMTYLLVWRHALLAGPILILAVLNKETAIFFPLIVAVGTWVSGDFIKYRKSLGVAAVCGLATFCTVRIILADVPGTTMEFHLFRNLGFWFSWLPWVSVTTPHMSLIPLPKPVNIVVLVVLVTMISAYWRLKPIMLRGMLVAALVILLPLFFLFCWQDEFRNFSLLFPFLHLAAMQTIAVYMDQSDEMSPVGRI